MNIINNVFLDTIGNDLVVLIDLFLNVNRTVVIKITSKSILVTSILPVKQAKEEVGRIVLLVRLSDSGRRFQIVEDTKI